MKKSIYIILTIINLSSIFGQQSPNYSQYMLNGFLINPALAGYDGYAVINLTSRQQWIGMKDAPRTYSLSAQGRILSRSYIIKKQKVTGSQVYKPSRKGRTGLGFSIDNDMHGIFRRTSFNLAYAHHISFPNAQWSFGMAFTGAQFTINTSSLKFRNDLDKVLISSLGEPVLVPDFTAGTFYYNRTMVAGFSIANLFESYIKFGGEKLRNYKLKRQYNIIYSYKLSQNADYSLEPSLFLKTNENLLMQLDLTMKAFIKEQYWVGISYRTSTSVVALVGVQKNKFFFGYAFDYSFNALNISSYGSHEITAAVRFGESVRRYRWLNRY